MSYASDKEPLGLTAKTTPVDADVVILGDSADATEVAKKTTWANVKATLKTYFDTLYQPLSAVLTATTASFTTADETKLDGIETGAQVNTVTASNTVTFTNKRVTPRTGSTTSSATPTINTDNVDLYQITAQAVDITSFTTNLSGTPTHGQSLIIEITGTAARAITWGASFEASTVALPTTTVTTAMLTVGFKWNSTTSKWRCIASA